MDHSPITSHRGAAIVAFAVSLIILGGCSNLSVAPTAKNAGMRTAARANWSSGGYTLKTVDDSSGTYNELTGINNSNEVVGNYTNSLGSRSNPATWNSYVSQAPYSSFQNVTFPNAQSTYMYAISNPATSQQPIEIGYVVNPAGNSGDGGELGGTWGLVDNQGLWSIIKKHPKSNQCTNGAVGELLGFDSDTQVAIGFTNDYYYGCRTEAEEVSPGDNGSTIVIPNTINSEGTGIASNSDIVGFASRFEDPSAGWFASSTSGPFTFYHYGGGAGKLVTAFTGITGTGSSSNDVIVGWYTDAASKTHGLVFAKSGGGTWSTVDGPTNSKFLVVNGINAGDDICGWYEDQSGVYHGFVGTPSAPLRKHRQNRLKAFSNPR